MLQSCNSPDSFDCVKKSGEITTVKINEFDDFNELVISDNITLEIVESDEEYFELTYGKNLIPKITLEQKNDSLSFFNLNNCGWTRDFKKPKLKWFTNKPTLYINSMSNGQIFSTDTIKSNIILRIENGINDIEFIVDNASTTLVSNSASNFVLSGRSNFLKIAAYFNDGKYDCSNLIVKRADVLQRGYNDIIVNVQDSLVGSIENAGRILYKGNPGVDVSVDNGGELIHLDEE